MAIRSSRTVIRQSLSTDGSAAASALRWLTGFAFALSIVLGLLVRAPLVIPAIGVATGFLAWLAQRLDRGGRGQIARIAVFGFAIRCATAAILFTASTLLGHGGYLMYDDRAYGELAWGVAQYLHGQPHAPYLPPLWGGDYYLLGTFVYVEIALFTLLGKQVLVMIMLNGAITMTALLLMWQIARELFGATAARLQLLVACIFPSLILFSAANLKDPLGLLVISAVLWLVTRYERDHRLIWIALALVVLQPLHLIHYYLYYLLLGLVPIGVLLASAQRTRIRLRNVAAATAAALIIGSVSAAVAQDLPLLGGDPLVELQHVRYGLSFGRTAFVPTPTPVTASPAAVAARTSVATTAPTTVPIQTTVPRQTAVVQPTSVPVETVIPVSTTVPRGTGVASTTVTTQTTVPIQTTVPVEPTSASRQLTPRANSIVRTVTYLPFGLSHALFAPFPWSARQLIDLPAIPDVILWYFVLAAAIWSLWKTRSRWLRYAFVLTYVAVLTLVSALFEGNAGTLLRHRAMTIAPAVLLLSGYGLVAAVARLRHVSMSRPARLPSVEGAELDS